MSPIRSLCVLFFPREAHSKPFQTSKIELIAKIVNDSHCVKSMYPELFWSVFSRIRPEFLRIRILFLRSVSVIKQGSQDASVLYSR